MPHLAEVAQGFAMRPPALAKIMAYAPRDVSLALEDPCTSCQWIWEQFAQNMPQPLLTSIAPSQGVKWDSKGEYVRWKAGFDVTRIENLILQPNEVHHP